MTKPLKMTNEDLANILEGMAKAVRAGDSFEGSITYTCIDAGMFPDHMEPVDTDNLERGHMFVGGAFRVGNSQGQGGMELFWDYE